ncbi:MAG: hypothetical protein OIF51_16545 [Cellvibrionaceae bacterium]|nr:hypothetical protein [Cellvibrionaceae bacterium]
MSETSLVIKNQANLRQNQDKISSKIFKGVHIEGITRRISFSNAEVEINQIWADLYSMEELLNQAYANKDQAIVYAFYRDFNSNMDSALLTVGFSDISTSSSQADITSLPNGHFKEFAIDNSSGLTPNKAWEAAYYHQNLIEKNLVDQEGQYTTTKAIVVLN